MTTININQFCKVKLTEEGKRILRLHGDLNPNNLNPDRCQLWELFQVFGRHMYNGCEIPFENNLIEVENRPKFDRDIMTSQDAKQKMLDWAEGKLSHWDDFPTPYDNESIRRTLSACAAIDSYEVKKWSAVFIALLKEEEMSNAK